MTEDIVAASEREQASAFLESHPEIEVIEVFIADANGVLRGKWLPRNAAMKVFEGGIRLPRSALSVDIWGQDVIGSGLVFETGDSDGICVPVPGTLKTVPWLARPTAQVQMTMLDADATPYFGDPRQVLGRVLDLFAARGLTPVVATELEFYLFDKELDAAGRPQAPISPVTGQRQTTSQVYGIDDLQEFEGFLADVARACAAQDIPADTAIAENAPGQYEINLNHVADAQAAADHAVLLKRALKGIAKQHGLFASFMAKPYGEQAGNGMHVHFSLIDEAGDNVFDDGSAQGSDLLRQAIAGMAATMNDGMAVFAAHANSYRRFQRGAHAPTSPSWGYDNRTTALRIPLGSAKAMRVEHRVASADTNPYLTLAVILAGAYHGIAKELSPPPVTEGDAYAQEAPKLATTWDQALAVFEGSSFIGEYLGAPYQALYAACKRQEQAVLGLQVTDVEYDTYLRTV
jgi:glutamine synthetase